MKYAAEVKFMGLGFTKKVKLQANKMLAEELSTENILLGFDCKFSCECGTCSITFENEKIY